MLDIGRDRYHCLASPSKEYINIFNNTSSWWISSWSMYWWNSIKCCVGWSWSSLLNIGRNSPHSSIVGTLFGKSGVTKKLKGENLAATMASMDFDILNRWSRQQILPLWSRQWKNCSLKRATNPCSPSKTGSNRCQTKEEIDASSPIWSPKYVFPKVYYLDYGVNSVQAP